MASLVVHSAHQPGFNTCLAFSVDGLSLHTGGEDGLVRKWPLDSEGGTEPEPADEADEPVTSLATSKTCWLSASLDSCVRTYDVHGTTMEGFVTRATAVPVRCVSIDPKGERVAVASDELEVKIINLNDITNIKTLEGHRKGVRRVTWHPSGSLLTTCGGEGDIIVWDVSPGEEPKQIETISGIIPAADPESLEFAHDCAAVWHPSGKYFVVASRTHELAMISRDNWTTTFTLSDDEVTGATTALAISPNGTYLASASKTGVFIWSTATRKILFRHVFSSNSPMVLQLAFSPTQNLLAWTDADGNLLRWPNPIPDSSPDPVKAHSASSSVGLPLKKKSDPLFFDDDAQSAEKGQAAGDVVGDDDYGMDDDWMIDDIGLLDKVEKEKDTEEKGFAREMVSVTKAQPPFQPASTPMANKKRYLAYNMIGVIEVTDQDSHHIVNVEFFDRSTRAGSHFQDTLKYNVASLGERGALYACLPEDGHPAQIAYKPYSGWASSGEWQYTLSAGEKVIAIAAGGIPPTKSLREQSSDGDLEGNGNVVVATNHGYLRFFTGGGVQRYLWALGAEVVSMVAGREWVFVVHRDGGTSLDGCQNLSYMLIALDTFDVVQCGRLPLPRGTILKWIGISEEGAPAIYDSNGLLSILDRFRRPSQARWTPLLDTTTLERRKGKDESYWPVGVSGTLFMCLILKGREEHPGFPRPLIQELEIQMPLFNLDVPQGQMEERFLREELQIGMLRDALGSELTTQDISQREFGLDKELIQLIQLACKGDKLQRALDVAALLHNTVSFDMAIKVAQFYHLMGLQEKLTSLKSEREEVDRLEEERDQRKRWGRQSAPIAAPQSNTRGPTNRRQFEEFAPRSATVRKSLAPAVPVIGGSKASHSVADSTPTIALQESVSSSSLRPPDADSWDDSFETETSMFEETPSISDGKRKREESTAAEDLPEPSSAPKKRVISGVKTSNNPFARKPQESKNNNPFSRPVASKPNVATKSNSFFEKVDEANDIATQSKATAGKRKGKDKEKEKEKEKKDTTRQTTLFGLPPGPAPEKKGRGRPSKDKKGEAEDGTPAPTQPAQASMSDADTTEVTRNAHSADIIMANGESESIQQDTDAIQPNDTVATQVPGSPEPEIEWPPSPPRPEAKLVAADVTVN